MIAIEVPSGRAPLYYRYPRKNKPQSAYLAIDTANCRVWWDYDHEISGGVPVAVYNNIVRRIDVHPNVSGEALARLTVGIESLAERVIAGSGDRWDGHSHVGYLDFDAQDALDEIECLLSAITPGDGDTTEVWDASDYLNSETDEGLGLTADTTDDECDALGAKIEEQETVEFADNVSDYLHQRRDALRAARLIEDEKEAGDNTFAAACIRDNMEGH